MATAPAIANDDQPIVAGEIILIPVAQVEIGERMRDLDEFWALALGNVMAREGQQTPIEVCRLPGKPGWRLVAGAHRLTGARAVGMELIEAREVSNSMAHRKMREISENLWRRDLDPIDRAAFMAELVILKREAVGLEAAAHRSASVAKRWQQELTDEAEHTVETISNVYGFSEEIGVQLGLSGRTVRNDLLLYRRLAPSQVAKLRAARHPLATNAAQLRVLTKLDHSEQEQAIDLLLGGSVKTIGDAIAKMKGTNRATNPDDKRLSAFIGTFHRMDIAEKRGALFHLAPLLPAGAKLVEDGKALVGALDAAFKILVQLSDGEAVEDEDIHEACGLVQSALLRLNAGATQEPQGNTPAAPAAGAEKPTAPSAEPVADPAPTPAVAIRASVKPDYLVCLECGEKHGQLTRHLRKHELTTADYLKKWRLPLDYPFTAPNVSEARRQAARKLGLRSGVNKGDAA
ncbi:MucR family transcriptional regulator [Sphingomonas sp. ERG5]|uniref:MucR family transcriptional regulator n=1 Tax=Sphingomonas sp. ERG5 TaxID=1381597 RepID=UPI000691B4CD|nr:MucR family transcriptional regulator [Sphingomonas sp. ERG5]